MLGKGVGKAGWAVQDVCLEVAREEDGRLELHEREIELFLDGLQVLWELGGGVHADLGEEGEGVRV